VAASLSGLTLGSVVVVAAIPHPPGGVPPLETTPVTACQQAAVSTDRQWLSAGITPVGSPQVTSMATRALLDLHLSTRPDGAVIAGWHNRWEYSWPRDSSWAAVALAYAGHAGDSLRILRFLLPGSDWPGNRTTAWTAETAFFALSDAETGHRQQASQLLTWFATHTTRLGTLPEKVDARGQPVSAAPLAWTDAAVLLTLVAQAHRLPVVPIPTG